jgi:cysteine desulfurase
MDSIYLDHNATSPLRGEALEAMRPWLEDYGNASSTHLPGQKARAAVESARERLAGLLKCKPQEIYFTSGGTESNNLAIFGALRASSRGRHAVSSQAEHHSVLNAFHALPGLGFQASLIGVGRDGRISLQELEAALKADTVLVSLMHANNETGVVQPLGEAGELCHSRRVVFHTDAVQTFGKLPLDLSHLPVDLLSASAHKFGGPQGVGLLFVREGQRLVPLMQGGEQEGGIRPGTENVAGIVGMAAAAEAAWKAMQTEREGEKDLRDRLESGLKRLIPGLKVNGEGAPRLANTLSVRFPGVENDLLVIKLDQQGLHVSSGSACAAGAVEPSHVLLAMGLKEAEARSVIRFSLGPQTTGTQIDHALEIVPAAVKAFAGAVA